MKKWIKVNFKKPEIDPVVRIADLFKELKTLQSRDEVFSFFDGEVLSAVILNVENPWIAYKEISGVARKNRVHFSTTQISELPFGVQSRGTQIRSK